MRWLRLNYVVPRIALLVVLYLLAEVGSGYLVRWGIVTGGSAAVGAKVEVANAKASLLETQLQLTELKITNPQSPMKNLVEVDRIDLDFNTTALLRRKLVADYGIVSGIAFDTDRDHSGAIEKSPASNAQSSWLRLKSAKVATAWLDGVEDRLTTDIRSQLQSIQLAEQLSEKWPSRYQQLQSQAEAIKADARRLEEEWKTAKKNPLRHADFLTRVPQETTQLRRALRDIQAEIAALPNELKADREAVRTARLHDEAMIREFAQVEQIDPQALADYMLGQQVTGHLGEAVGWLRLARKFVPPSAKRVDRATSEGRGTNVTFAGARRDPNVLVKLLRLEGTAQIAGQEFDLVGTLHNWSTDPVLVGEPTILDLKATGHLPLVVHGSFDRTGQTPRDHFVVRAHGIDVPPAQLGGKGPISIAMAPSTAELHLDFQLRGENLEGQIRLTHEALQLTPKTEIKKIGEPLQLALTSRLQGLNNSETAITLSGSLDAPEFAISSSLGTQLASAIQGAVAEVAQQQADQLLAQSRQQMDDRLAQLDSQLAKFRSKLDAELVAPGELVATLLGQPGKGPDQIGGLLPTGSLFK